MRALYTAATGMMAQELNVQVISNNIANMRTTGYKHQRAEFQDLLYEHVRRVGTQTSDQGNIVPVGVDIGGGVKTVGTPRIMTQGTLSPTGNDLDVAIRGEGFFKILMPDGTFAYTRDGSFEIDARAASSPRTAIRCSPASPSRRPPPASPSTAKARSRSRCGRDHADRARPAQPDPLHQQGRPAADRRQPVRRDAGLRPAAGRHRQRRRLSATCSRAASNRPTSKR